jgi:hypothetical protein
MIFEQAFSQVLADQLTPVQIGTSGTYKFNVKNHTIFLNRFQYKKSAAHRTRSEFEIQFFAMFVLLLQVFWWL